MRQMKDSNLEWVGQIPAYWDFVKFKSICTPKSILNSGGRELLSVYLDRGVIKYSDSTNMQVHKPSESLDKYQNVDIGDLVMNNQQAWRGSVGVSKYKGIISPAYLIYKLSDLCYPDYMNYVFRDSAMVQQYEYCSRGVGSIQRNVYPQWLKQALVLLPPFKEQQKIADFLDAKCIEIDNLIADIEKQIESLEEYKRSTIAEAVTKGLNPKAELKESGIEWLGKIPIHWKKLPIRVLFDEIKTKNILGKEKQALQFKMGTIIPKTNFDADLEDYVANTILNYTIVDPGTVMINGLNLNFDFATQRVALVKNRGVITSAYMAIKLKDVTESAEYYTYLLKNYDNCKAFHNMGGGVRKILNFDELKRHYVIVPPVCEQWQIVEYLDEKCSKIDECIAEKKKQIETLQNYKKSLIFEYVTGKKEVV